MWDLIVSIPDHCLSVYSVVRRCVCMCVNIFKHLPAETTEPIEAKFHVEPPWNVGTKVSSNGPGPMTKMATMPIYVKNLFNKYSPEPKDR